jgi:hypothetical protein
MLGFRRPLCRNSNVKPSHLLVSCLCFALAACGQHDASPATRAAPATEAAQPARKQVQLTAEDIAAIKASGKTGIWAEPTEICSKNAHRGTRATLTWNAGGQADKVVVVLVNRKGKERMFGGGASIGRKQTGKWVHPGMVFKLLNASDRSELGSVAFTEKQCG